ncbi:small integral membrane protein 1 isoform X2 [Callorhinchus milii]|uniref:Small integral membrane protein 1 (Vel blood group) n=2 Tax=Callorhinchus milii TaxID=7868 RepID=V9L9C4_CALMI|nr:small integral membrane protein 1 isoform X2 [Callorhinchus milii]|eukprot:gi/632977659/ref/XP_007905470.1/ PREDICTED: small integral membrane protein 1 isoform X2 [Callorhinchus milii]
MQSQETEVQYSRWNENSHDQVTIGISPIAASGYRKIYNRFCTGKVGIALKVLGGIITFWIIFMIGYVTGYYVHRCK